MSIEPLLNGLPKTTLPLFGTMFLDRKSVSEEIKNNDGSEEKSLYSTSPAKATARKNRSKSNIKRKKRKEKWKST